MKAASQIISYFRAVPRGKQRVLAATLNRELQQAGVGGESDAARVNSWARENRLAVTSEGNPPTHYTFTTQT